MGDHTCFFYGTLMSPPVLHRVLYGTSRPEPWQKGLTSIRPALLPGYQRHRVKNCDYPAIIATENGKGGDVRGAVVSGLTEGDLWRLDIFEGSEYKRKKVTVRLLDGNGDGHGDDATVEAESYVWMSGREKLEDQEWDFEHFQREKMRFWSGEEIHQSVPVDDGFREVEEAVRLRKKREEGQDPMGGRGMNGDIGRKLDTVLNSAV